MKREGEGRGMKYNLCKASLKKLISAPFLQSQHSADYIAPSESIPHSHSVNCKPAPVYNPILPAIMTVTP